MSSARPRVVVTAGAANPRRIDLYVQGVVEAGGEAIVVRPGESMPDFDALLLTGGPDLQPGLYGQEADPALGAIDAERDELEMGVLARAREQAAPVLAICRGLQLVNVAFGGTLRQHVEGHVQSEEPELDVPAHPVSVVPQTRLAQLAAGDRIEVNSFHHQVVDRLGRGLEPSARDGDGTVEAFETPDGSIVAVQCHPERMLGSPWARALFADLVSRAAARP